MTISENDPVLVALRAAAHGDETAQAEFWRLRRQRALARCELEITDAWAELDPATRSTLERHVPYRP